MRLILSVLLILSLSGKVLAQGSLSKPLSFNYGQSLLKDMLPNIKTLPKKAIRGGASLTLSMSMILIFMAIEKSKYRIADKDGEELSLTEKSKKIIAESTNALF